MPASLPLFGQAPVVQWQKIWGSTNSDYANVIRPTSDGGYIVVGYTQGADGDVIGYHGRVGLGDLWVIKMNSFGQMEWQKSLGGTYQEIIGPDILQTPDGGFLVAGSAASQDCGMAGNHGGLDCWIVKLKPNGDIAWQNMIGADYNEYVHSINPTADGGYIIAGESNSSSGLFANHHGTNTTSDWWLTKIDATGSQIWQVTLGGTLNEQCTYALPTPDGGAIAVGTTWSTDGDITGLSHGRADYLVVKVDNAGTVQWMKTYGGSQDDLASGIRLTTDGGYIIAGQSASNDGDITGKHGGADGSTDYWVVKLNSTGAIQWQKCFGGSGDETFHYIQNTADGGYVLAGTTASGDGDVGCNSGSNDGWVLKIDASGNPQWSKVLGGKSNDELFSIQPLTDGSFIVGATTCSADMPGYHPLLPGGTGDCGDFWVIKLSASQATPAAPTVSINPADASICAGSTSTFMATITNSGVRPSFQWTLNGLPVGDNSTNYTAKDFHEGDVVGVNVTAGTGECEVSGGTASSSVTVHINTTVLTPTVTISSSAPYICDCASSTFTATVTGGGSRPYFQWELNNVVMGTNTDTWLSNGLLPTDVVFCLYSDSSGCISHGSVKSNLISLLPGQSKPAYVSITGPAQPQCAGTPVTYLAAAQNAGARPGFQWMVNGVITGPNAQTFTSSTLNEGDIITCTIIPDGNFPCTSGGNTTSNPLTFHLPANLPPMVDVSAPFTTICTGHPLTLTATTKYAGTDPGYQWSVNGMATGSNSPQLTANNFTDGDLVQCSITVDPTYTCALQPTAASALLRLTVLDQPDPTVNIVSTALAACAGSTIQFDADAENAGTGAQYQWLVNNVATGGDNPTFSSSGLTDGAVIVCSVTPGSGACLATPVVSNPLTETIWPVPSAGITPGDTIIAYNGQIVLHAELSPDVSAYQWSPAAELEDALTLNPSTIPLHDSVRYTLTVQSLNQCSSKAVAVIRLFQTLRMPDAFTPNGDGKNDLFRIPPGSAVKLQQFSVYNRWGHMMFMTKNAGQGWDGTFNGHLQPAGVYVYVVTGSNPGGPVNARGTFVLVR